MMDWTPPPPLACSLTPIHAPTPLIPAVVEEIHEDWLIGKQYLSLVDFKPQENPISDHSQSNYRKTVA